MILAADIGATKTLLALFSTEKGVRNPACEETFTTADFEGIPELIAQYLKGISIRVEDACLGIAAPISAGEARMINLPWVIRENELKSQLKLRSVRLINDLEAIAFAVPALTPRDLRHIHGGQARPGGTIAVIAPGTGLGQAYLVWTGKEYEPQASEGGHADFAPRNSLEIRLLEYLLERFEHVSFERVCSGPGIYNIYCFLRDRMRMEEPESIRDGIGEADDPTPLIIEAAMAKESGCEICVRALEIFTSVLGAETGNLALKVKSTGGIFIGGGIPLRVLPYIDSKLFSDAFRSKGRETFLVSAMPIHVILNAKAGLLGAAICGLKGVRS